MTLDHDGKIRMDCSSPYAMASLVERRDAFDVSTGNDADADRHGIVTPDAGLMNPNHFLAVAIDYLLMSRTWPDTVAIGKTLVSSSMIDRVVAARGRRLLEVPVGFKWFVPGLLDGSVAFGGEESAGRELPAPRRQHLDDRQGRHPAGAAGRRDPRGDPADAEPAVRRLTERFGDPAYARVDAAASRDEKARLGRLSADQVTATELAGDPITARLTTAPGNDAPIGGLKVVTERAWFAARPSGTEDVYKVYAESFAGPEHLERVQDEATAVVSAALHD